MAMRFEWRPLIEQNLSDSMFVYLSTKHANSKRTSHNRLGFVHTNRKHDVDGDGHRLNPIEMFRFECLCQLLYFGAYKPTDKHQNKLICQAHEKHF